MMDRLIVEQINTLSSFEKIREEWERLYRLDSESNVYISWSWLFGSFSFLKTDWIILSVKNENSSSYVAFLPLTFEKIKVSGILAGRKIIYGGKPLSVYSGFLCLPDSQKEAIELLAEHIHSKLKWDTLQFTWTMDPRIRLFVKSFHNSRFVVSEKKGLPALIISLPDNYETYLYKYLNNKDRYDVRFQTRQIKESKKYFLRYADKETIDEDLNALCELWVSRWKREHHKIWYRQILKQFFEDGLLHLSVIWDNDTPISALACTIDPVNQSYNTIITSYNPDYKKIAPGIVLFAESIKRAIEEQYRFYDFTVGLDAYKVAFGPEIYETKDVFIRRKNIKTFIAFGLIKNTKKSLKKITSYLKHKL